MTRQQWLFSLNGRIRRRDFWIWVGMWIIAMLLLFVLADCGLLERQNAAFVLVCLLWPTAAVVVKRFHDRGKSGRWALLLIIAWMLFAGNWVMLEDIWHWVVGRLIPVVIMVMMLFELGVLLGTPGENKFGKATSDVKFF